jgi:hypothetical protein
MKKASILMALSVLVASAWISQSEAQQKVSYKVSGIMVETCACNLICPCSVGGDTNNPKGCQASVAMHITSGKYGDVKLDGLTAVALILKPEKNISAAIGKLEGGLYIDAKANEAQRNAIGAIITDQFGALFSKVAGPKVVPISFTKSMADSEGLSDEYSVEIPNILSLKISAIKNPEGKRSAHMNLPGGFLPIEYMAKSAAHTYNDKEWATMWDFGAGRDAFYGKFEFASK